MRRMLALGTVVAGMVVPGWAGDLIFTDSLESGAACSWSSEYAACGGGTEVTVTLPGGVPLTMVYVPSGTYWMGSPVGERGRLDQEDLHQVVLTHGYYIGTTEVTQAQWQAVTGSNPSDPANPVDQCPWGFDGGFGPSYPVFCVSWEDIAAPGGFIDQLNAYLSSSGQGAGFRLPTEAEWERATRAGNQDRFSYGDVLECDDYSGACAAHEQFMWWGGNTTGAAHPGGSKQANAFGLFDPHGNVAEWVQDWWQSLLGTSPATDPTGPATGSYRVHRGGDYYTQAMGCRSADRDYYDPAARIGNIGFRLARTAS